MAKRDKLSNSEKIQASVSLVITIFAGSIIWTNNAIDFFNKLGWSNLNPGQATIIFLFLLCISVSWFIVSIANKFL